MGGRPLTLCPREYTPYTVYGTEPDLTASTAQRASRAFQALELGSEGKKVLQWTSG